jgi:hypothetical protein
MRCPDIAVGIEAIVEVENEPSLYFSPVIWPVHGERDGVAPAARARELAAADPATVRLWTLPARAHGDCQEQPGFWTAIDASRREPAPAPPPPGPRGGTT